MFCFKILVFHGFFPRFLGWSCGKKSSSASAQVCLWDCWSRRLQGGGREGSSRANLERNGQVFSFRVFSPIFFPKKLRILLYIQFRKLFGKNMSKFRKFWLGIDGNLSMHQNWDLWGGIVMRSSEAFSHRSKLVTFIIGLWSVGSHCEDPGLYWSMLDCESILRAGVGTQPLSGTWSLSRWAQISKLASGPNITAARAVMLRGPCWCLVLGLLLLPEVRYLVTVGNKTGEEVFCHKCMERTTAN